MDLNNEQMKAVTYGDGPLLVLAGAGSGKTRVLTHRFAYLLNKKNVSPENLLAVTFTNKAASEMRSRVESLTGVPASNLWVSTFHSFCLRILRRFAAHIGYRNDFVIFDEFDQITLLKNCLKALNISDEQVSPAAALNRISRAKDDYITPEIYEKNATNFWDKRFAPLYKLYQSELKRQNAMDFGDLIVNVLELFQKDGNTLSIFQKKFLHAMVDEYQDTNHVQCKLIKLLGDVHKNVFVVGDEDQSIYKWRGADIKNILEFQNDFPGAEVIRLEQNYRSTPSILGAANSVIKRNEGRLGKTLWTNLPDRGKVAVISRFDGLAETKYVAEKIMKLVGEGRRYDDAAVFYRTNAQSRAFEECFRGSGIPYVIYGGIKFYERMEIKNILAYLKYILDSHNDTALQRIINVPNRGIGHSTIEKVQAFARSKGVGWACAIDELVLSEELSSRARKSLREFKNMIEGARDGLQKLSLGELVEDILERSGYLASLKSSLQADESGRVENIEEFVRATYEFSGVAATTLPEFLDQVALVSDTDNMDFQRGAVPLMTVHLSKGLEFPVVFLVGMEEGLFPHSRSIDEGDELEEERRLCYVGMTRAREKLFMTYATRRKLYGREQYNLPSRFLDEIDKKYVDYEELAARTYEGPFRAAMRPAELGSRISHNADDGYFDQRTDDEKGDKIKVGTKVRHPVFGDGIVQRVEGSGENKKVMVRFGGNQLKTLLLKYAQLEILP